MTFFISLFDQIYWITGSVLGAVLGQLMTLDTTGIDFSMTALFVVIVVNQWLENRNHFSAITGFITALLAVALLGPDHFLLPALTVTVLILLICRKKVGYQEVQP